MRTRESLSLVMVPLASRLFLLYNQVMKPQPTPFHEKSPHTCADVHKLYHFIRTPTWVVPPRIQTMATFGASADILGDIEIDEQENFTPSQIQKFKEDPKFYRTFVKAVEKDVNGNFPIVRGYHI